MAEPSTGVVGALDTKDSVMASEHDYVARFPTCLLAITLTLTVATFSWVVWTTFVNHRDLAFQSNDTRLEKLNGDVMCLDEVLTMSARMAAPTGESRWEQRYRQYEPELDAANNDTKTLASAVSGITASEQTDVANVKLVAMENQAFALVRDGRSQEARLLIRPVTTS